MRRARRKPPKKVTVKTVERAYALFNKAYFYNSLPKNVLFKVEKHTSHAHGVTNQWHDPSGAFLYWSISFNEKLWALGRRLVFVVLLHEMLHIAAGLRHGHKEVYQVNKRRLIRLGAYDRLL